MISEIQAKPGDVVTATYRGTHVGLILDRSDPRAWADTLAFPGREPRAAEVQAHLADCAARGLSLARRVPIRWCFGMTDWEPLDALRAAEGSRCLCLQQGLCG